MEIIEHTTELARFNVTDMVILDMEKVYMPLVIDGIDDATGFKRVHEARMVVKDHRVKVEKTRKELKADALEYGRKIDAEAKRITALLDPIEQHLLAEENAVIDEKERIKNAERLRLEAEQKAKEEAEAARLKSEHDAEVEKIRIRTEATEKAKIETERRIAREAEAAKEKSTAEEAAKAKAELLKPDREKLLAVAAAVKNIEIPKVSLDATDAAREIRQVLASAATKIHLIADGLVPSFAGFEE